MLFIYGTLRKGGGNRRIIEKHIKALLPAAVTGTLFTDGRIPFLIRKGGTKIQGELVELIDEKSALGELDKFEGVEYSRRKIAVTTEHGQREKAWAYLYYRETTPNNFTRIQSGDWIRYCEDKK